MADPEEECWIWVAFAPEYRLLLVIVVGPRIQECADRLIAGIDTCLDDSEELPLFVSDGNGQYRIGLLNLYNETIVPPRTGKRGRPRKPYQKPRVDLKYGQVVKKRRGRKLVKVYKRIIYGTEDQVPLSELTTSYIERQNLTFRQENERLARKTLGFSKDDYWLFAHLTFYLSYFNFVRPHSGLKERIDLEITGCPNRKYTKRTPMMATGKTDHIWTLDELLRFPYHTTSVD